MRAIAQLRFGVEKMTILTDKLVILVTSCNSSSGTALFGRMEHKVLVWFIPDLKKSDREVLVHTSHHSATLPGRWKSQNNEARIIVCKWSHKSWLGPQGRGFDPERTVCFSGLQTRGNDCTMKCAYSKACCWQTV